MTNQEKACVRVAIKRYKNLGIVNANSYIESWCNKWEKKDVEGVRLYFKKYLKNV